MSQNQKIIVRSNSLTLPDKTDYFIQPFLKSQLKRSDFDIKLESENEVYIQWPKKDNLPQAKISLVNPNEYNFKHNSNDYSIILPNEASLMSEARAVIAREHYQPPPQRGLYFLLRDSNKKSVGAAVIDKIMYSSPTGRIELALKLNKRIPDHKIPGARREEVETLGVYCITRITVIKKFQGQSLGSAFLQNLTKFSQNIIYPTPRSYELMRVVSKSRSETLIEKNSTDFVIQSGFKLAKDHVKTAGLYFFKDKKLESLRRLYYYYVPSEQ